MNARELDCVLLDIV